MKILIILGVLTIVFTSCGTLVSPETQYERERLIEAYDAAREKHNPERVKDAVKDLLVGKWQYVGLEVEKGSVTARRANSMPLQPINAPTPSTAVASKGVTSEQAAPNASERAEAQNLPHIEAEAQTPEANATRLPPIEVEDEESNQKMLGAKAALIASTRKNLTLEFFEDRGSYHYSGSNRGTNVTGRCSITTKRYGDDPLPFISFNQRTGPEMLEFLFGSEPIKQMIAKKKQADAERRRRMGAQIGGRASAKTAYTIASIAGITVTEDTLFLVLYGDMELTPQGWMRTGGLRCTFKRIE